MVYILTNSIQSFNIEDLNELIIKGKHLSFFCIKISSFKIKFINFILIRNFIKKYYRRSTKRKLRGKRNQHFKSIRWIKNWEKYLVCIFLILLKLWRLEYHILLVTYSKVVLYQILATWSFSMMSVLCKLAYTKVYGSCSPLQIKCLIYKIKCQK